MNDDTMMRIAREEGLVLVTRGQLLRRRGVLSTNRQWCFVCIPRSGHS